MTKSLFRHVQTLKALLKDAHDHGSGSQLHELHHYGVALEALDEIESVETVLRRTLTAIQANARSYHGDDAGKGRALNVIGNWADDALAGRLHPSVELVTDA